MIILVDMDGVLADMDSHLEKKWFAEHPDFPPPSERLDWNFESWVPEHLHEAMWDLMHTEGFFYEIPEMPGARDAMHKMAERHDVFICTSPVLSRHCALEKWDWVSEHLGPEWTRKMIITADKTIIHGDYLIDDKVRIKGAVQPSWKQVVFGDHAFHRLVTDKLRMQSWEDISTLFPLPRSDFD